MKLPPVGSLEGAVVALLLIGMYWHKSDRDVLALTRSAKGKPTQNGKCERFIRTFKESEVYLNEYTDLADARRPIRKFLEEVSMTKRIHSARDDVTPAEFEAECRAKAKRKGPGR